MSRIHKVLVVALAVIIAVLSFLFGFDYGKIASEGLTLSSIVLAVYVAATMGLINTDLAKKLATTPSSQNAEHTQLGQLTIYFKHASLYAIATIVISSIVLLLPEIDPKNTIMCLVYQVVSMVGLVVYALNLMFMGLIIRFMLNRQIWDQ